MNPKFRHWGAKRKFPQTYGKRFLSTLAGWITEKKMSSTFGLAAQSVERWTLRGEKTRPCEKGLGFEARWALDVYEPPGGHGYGWWQAVAG